jgi:fucose permease
MAQDIIQYFTAHPKLLAALALIAVLAIIGLWYVIAHHLTEIVVSLLSFGGLASGVVVLYRGATLHHSDLVAIGLFLIVLFPIIFLQAIRRSKVAQKSAPPATPGPVPPPKAA